MKNKRYAVVASLLTLISLLPNAWAAGDLFKTPRIFDSGNRRPTKMLLANVNSDDIPDLLISNGSTITFLAGNADGSFQPPQVVYAKPVGPMAVGDVNNDGRLDLVVTTGFESESGFDIAIGKGDGTFEAPEFHKTRGLGVSGIAVSDINNDGIADVMAACECSASSCTVKHRVGIFLGTGGGAFGPERVYQLPLSGTERPIPIKVADVNHDGNSDLLFLEFGSNGVTNTSSLTVMLGRGDGTFRTPHSFFPGNGPNALTTADFNHDGKLDVAVAVQCALFCSNNDGFVAVLLGNGIGGFGPAQFYKSGAEFATGVDVGDVTADGNVDIVVSNFCTFGVGICGRGVVGVLRGNGDGTFNPAEMYNSADFFANDVAVADLNGDHKPDVAILNGSQDVFEQLSGSVSVLLGKAKFATQTTVESSANPSNFGEAVTLTATVTSASSLKPTGTVTFFRDGVSMGRFPLTEGVAQLTTTRLPLGSVTITATYNGSDLFIISTSPPLMQTVQAASSIH